MFPYEWNFLVHFPSHFENNTPSNYFASWRGIFTVKSSTWTSNLKSGSTCLGRYCALQDLHVIRFPTSTRIHRAIPAHFQQANVLQIGSILTCEPVLLLVQEFYKYYSHWCSMKMHTADVIHVKRLLVFRLFLCVEDEEREKCFYTFQKWHPAEEFSCRKKIRSFHDLLDLLHDKRDL